MHRRGRYTEQMNTNATQELLPPLSQEPSKMSDWFSWFTTPLPQQIMLPATGMLIMGLDWLFFSEEAATFGLALPFTILTGFLTGGLGTYHLQRKYGGDTRGVALAKSIAAGIVVGLPFPLAGSLAGAWIIANSGMASLKHRLWTDRFTKRR